MTERRKGRPNGIKKALLIGMPLLIGWLIPRFIELAVKVSVGDVLFYDAVAEVVPETFAWPGSVVMSLFSLSPFIVLSILMSQIIGGKKPRRVCYLMFCSGLIGILALMVPAYVDYWAAFYRPGRVSSTAGLIFVFVPIYCVGTLFVGIFIGKLISRLRWFQNAQDGFCQKCDYDLTGNTSGVCPECGEAVDGVRS